MIRIRDHFKAAMQQMAGNMQQRADGLIVPPAYIAGKHFGGFDGYEPWVQDCIRYACAACRGVQPDELPRITAWVLWTMPPKAPPRENDPRAGQEIPRVPQLYMVADKHAVVMQKMQEFAERVTDGQRGLTQKVEDQVTRVENGRERGTLMVIAMNGDVESNAKGEVMTSVSAWRPSDVEEAKAVPKQEYLLG